MSERLTLERLDEIVEIADLYDETIRVAELAAEVRALWAEREADDARMLELEWQGHEGCCPWCGRSKFHSHTIDCAMKQRCDEARARQGQ